METQKLIDLFTKALGVNCNVEKRDDLCFIEIMEHDQISDNFLQSCLDFLSKYKIETEILSYETKGAPVLQCNQSSSEEFEAKLELLNRAVELHEIAKMGDINAINEILKQGMNIDTTTINGETPLILAAYSASCVGPSALEFLLKNGANVNHQDQGGATALHIAVRDAQDFDAHNELSTIEILLTYKANPIIATNKGETPLRLADQARDIELGKIFIDAVFKNDFKAEKPIFDMQDLSDYWDNLMQNYDDKPETQEEDGIDEASGGMRVIFSQFFARSSHNSIADDIDEMERQLTATNLGR